MLVNANWLKKNIKSTSLKVLDSSWYLPNSSKNAFKEFRRSHIPGSIFFDIDEISEKSSSLPHMLPERQFFENAISKLGISDKNTIVIYCKDGIKTSPRVWWTFRYFGHKNVYVLNGGFRAWRLVNGQNRSCLKKKKHSPYKVKRIRKFLKISFSVLKNKYKDKDKYLIVDARPTERFTGEYPEPRKEIGRGNIPGSYSLPEELLHINGFMKYKSSLKKILNKINKKNKTVVCSCGSGISACNIAFALNQIGFNNYTVFDGSWTEWYIKTKN